MTIRTLAAASVAVLLMSSTAYAASDYLLDLGDVKGESKVAATEHKGWIEVESWSLGASNPTSVGSSGMSAGRMAPPPAGPGSVTVKTSGDAACAKGNHIPQAVLKGKTGSYTFQDLTVTACDVHGDPHEMTMSYGKVAYSDLSVMSSPTPKKGTK